jgi:hypothetical protein
MDEVRLRSRAFSFTISDAIVRVRAYDTQCHDGAFFNELYDLPHAQVGLIENGVIIRAGVAVGGTYVGVNGEGPLFGPALVWAYDIENQEAIYPRIVVDEHAIAEHGQDPRLRGEHNTIEFERRAIEELLATREDGTRYIDYLRARAAANLSTWEGGWSFSTAMHRLSATVWQMRATTVWPASSSGSLATTTSALPNCWRKQHRLTRWPTSFMKMASR